MRFTYLIVLMMAITVAFGRTMIKRAVSANEGPVGCLCFDDGDDLGGDDDDGATNASDDHSIHVLLSTLTPAGPGPGTYGSYCRNYNGGAYGNVRSCPAANNGCRTTCCRYCCFNDPRIGGD